MGSCIEHSYHDTTTTHTRSLSNWNLFLTAVFVVLCQLGGIVLDFSVTKILQVLISRKTAAVYKYREWQHGPKGRCAAREHVHRPKTSIMYGISSTSAGGRWASLAILIFEAV